MFFSEARARSRTWEASPSEHRKWVEVFKACDEDHKGYLSREDFKIAVVMLFGYKPSKVEVDSVMSSINPNTSGILLEGFLNIVRKKKEAQRYRNEVRHIFTAFDTYYRGFLTLEDFKKAFRQVAPKLPERTVLEVFRLLLNIIIAGSLAYKDEFPESLKMLLRAADSRSRMLSAWQELISSPNLWKSKKDKFKYFLKYYFKKL
ncbi:EF-hand calcium-binding domain-containing protein 11 isoform X9 [Symphalangus syndactylus]|uniref:EF-hand calcium-binding domain-containing protein 11 isoform X9 n=1 Tax=Symphalangus syndactylus TaxID=9590 RepID=UPI002441838D|nr:EF-hand calcium-binding domain-containing protein 11 isoform X3 [Symphalangus syndactylus]